MSQGWTIALDVGKSLAKATLWNEGGVCLAERSRANDRPLVDGRPVLDAVGIECWLDEVLSEFGRLGPVGSIIPVAHGAAAVLIDEGRMVYPPIDYEWTEVSSDRGAYDRQRDPFEATGSPALPAGLNLGAQLHWLESQGTPRCRSAQILPWAQYWAWMLSGVAASEVTSLGCHTDLWRPYDRMPTQLALRRGWADRLAPLKSATEILGTLAPAWVERTGLPAGVAVYCGLHDSNAALVAARSHAAIRGRDATVLSTGTWFVAMRAPNGSDPAGRVALPKGRDCLINVDVAGAAVPSARFMGGREIELLLGTGTAVAELPTPAVCLADIESLLKSDEFILPGLVPGVGPFPGSKQDVATSRHRGALAAILAHVYVALVADVMLDLIGSRDILLVEGRFSRAPVFVGTLAALRPDTAVMVGRDGHGVARGALKLVRRDLPEAADIERVAPLPLDFSTYRARWREAARSLA